ncbi:glycosyltransferase [Sphingomonas arantia]|uniref:Glycosyltransferase n=1 Tax=Sphingomonas arantia TaxID=1460676 RepID=A0ABW4U1K8_9SPHN
MKICFVGHVFHQKTQSHAFFTDILRRLGDVTELYSDPDGSPTCDDALIRRLAAERFDRILFWQTERVAERLLPLDLPGCIIVPMYDSVARLPELFWQRFVKSRFLSFSRAHHEALQRIGCVSHHFQYFPDPGVAPARAIVTDRLDGFFWERVPRSAVNRERVLAQCCLLGISRLHLHAVPDFADDDVGPPAADPEGVALSTSRWFDRREEYDHVAGTPLFFFAPRELEGIGMASLEAMARGQIVVGPSRPTLNEYVAHGTSGLLYEPADRADLALRLPLDRTRLAAMSIAARRKAEEGRRSWLKDIRRLISVVADDGTRWSRHDYSGTFVTDIQRAAHARMARAGDRPADPVTDRREHRDGGAERSQRASADAGEYRRTGS